MSCRYELFVYEPVHEYLKTPQETMGERLHRCIRCPYDNHIIVGRNASDELLLVACDQSESDMHFALREACGFYCCKVGDWPDFIISKGEVRKVSITGYASPQYLEFCMWRRMVVINSKEIERYERLSKGGQLVDLVVDIKRAVRPASTAS